MSDGPGTGGGRPYSHRARSGADVPRKPRRPGAYRKGLRGEPAADGPINEALHVAGTTILMCDATIPGRDEGRLDAETLAWMAATLDELEPESTPLIAFHQPPVELHHPLPNGYRLEQPGNLAALLAAYPRVAAVITGHAHTLASSTFGGLPLVAGPAVTWTLRMPWEGDSAADREQPPGPAFHVLDDERRLTAHFRVVL